MKRKELSYLLLSKLEATAKTTKSEAQKALNQRGVGLNYDQFSLLLNLSESAATSQAELARKTLRDPASITRSLDLLEVKKLLKRKAIKDNRRQYEVVLTKKGKAFVDKYADAVLQFQKEKARCFSKQELVVFIDFLERLKGNGVG
jgi:DNA-binding MarR family transcriptional regulator